MAVPTSKSPTDDADLYKSGVYILMDDIVLKEAISTLHDSVLYRGILSGELNVK